MYPKILPNNLYIKNRIVYNLYRIIKSKINFPIMHEFTLKMFHHTYFITIS